MHEYPNHGHRFSHSSQAGPLGDFLARLYAEVSDIDCEIHLVVDGAGAMVLDEMIQLFEALNGISSAELSRRISSLQIALPAIDCELAGQRILPLVEQLNRRAGHQRNGQRRTTDGTVAPASIIVPSEALQSRVGCGEYGKSLLHLIANAFEDRDGHGRGGRARTMLGMSEAHSLWLAAQDAGNDILDPFVELTDTGNAAQDASNRIDQVDLARCPALARQIQHTLAQHAARPGQQTV